MALIYWLFTNLTASVKSIVGFSGRGFGFLYMVFVRPARLIALMLAMAIIATSTPAAPQILSSMAMEARMDGWLWWNTSPGAGTLQRLFNPGRRPQHKPQEEQSERNARVRQIEIHPGDVTVQAGEPVYFVASAVDANSARVGGVKVNWRVLPEGVARMSPHGEFVSHIEGSFEVIAEGVGSQARVTVTVLKRMPAAEGERPVIKELNSRSRPAESVYGVQTKPGGRRSGRALRSLSSALNSANVTYKPASFSPGANSFRSSAEPATAAAPFFLPPDAGYTDGDAWSASDPGNRRGSQLGAPLDGGSSSGNFTFTAPVAALAGRGLSVNLGLAFNSRVWNKANTEMTFDIDNGWPAPGWSLGFGKIVNLGASSGYMIVDGDGTHHPFQGTLTQSGGSQSLSAYTTDGSFVNFNVYGDSAANGGQPQSGTAYLPNGTIVTYGARGGMAVYPTVIRDVNGNCLSISYRNNAGPQIDTVIDTLGRAIKFYYDANNLLTAITVPPLGGTGSDRTVARLNYRQITIGYSFPGMTVRGVGTGTFWAVNAIYYPATGTGYWFGDSDSYSSYGMIAKVSERAGMTLSASGLTDQGTISAGTGTTHETTYNYPMTAVSLSDAPTYTQRSETWAGNDTGQAAVTTYAVQETASPRSVTITQPDGTVSTQYSYNHPGQFDDGLIYQDSLTYNGVTLQSGSTVWVQGDMQTPRPTRTDKTDERGQTITTTYDYEPTTSSTYNNVNTVREYDYGGVIPLRTTKYTYLYSANYISTCYRKIVTSEAVYSGDGSSNAQRISLTEFQYDGVTLTDTPNAVQHDYSYDPYAPVYYVPGYCYYVGCPYACTPVCSSGHYESAYNQATDYRGNVTRITRYASAADATGAIIENRTYDITGNMITQFSSTELISVEFTLGTQYAYSTKVTRGSASSATARVTSSSTYDFNNGLRTQTTDMNGRVTQMEYYPDTLRPKKVTLPTGAYTNYDYDDNALTSTITTLASDGVTIADKTVRYLSGLGQTRREDALSRENGVDYWDIVQTQYDASGHEVQQTRPYRSGQTPQWTVTAYDKLGRVTTVTAPDGSQGQRFYNEASYPSAATSGAPGQTVRAVDPWGRERWVRSDALGQLAELVEPDPNGNGTVTSNGLLTQYSYDAMGNLTSVVQGNQQRSFRYDSLRRQTQQKLAEVDATLNDSGAYVGSGQWSSVLTYDDRSNLLTRIDARGVVTRFSYYNAALGVSDPLGRVQSITYDKSGVPSGLVGSIPSAASVSYQYVTTGDVTRLQSVTDGAGTESYAYDGEGRQSDSTRTFSSRPGYPLATDCVYDSLDRLTDITYPTQYGVLNTPRNVVHQNFDSASRLAGLLVDNLSHASQIMYNAASQALSLNVGGATNQLSETYTYDGATGLLTNQKVQRAGNPTALLDLSYNYLRASTTSGRSGQLTGINNNNDHNKDRGFVYDMIGRLKQATGGPGGSLSTQTYVYDRYGNRTSVTATGTSSTGTAIPRDGLASLSYTNGQGQVLTNRITTAGFQYDPDGNQTQAVMTDGSTQQYRYDAAGRLVQVLDGNGASLSSYTYGSSNRRLTATEGGQITYYGWEGDAVIAEFVESSPSTTPVWSKSYVYLGGRLLSTLTPGGTQYYHSDRLGTRVTTNAQDLSVSEQVTLPFGSALDAESSGSVTNRRFTSYDRSSVTKLDYAVNRFYNSQQGRFTQVDPIGMSAASMENPQSLNLYSYCGNDPVNHTDPNGLFLKGLWNFFKKALKWIIVAVAIVVAITSIFASLSVFAIIGAFASAASALLDALGYTTAANILGIIGGVADFLGSLASVAREAGRAAADMVKGALKKAIWKAIGDGASLASKILSATGHKIAGMWLNLAATVADFSSEGYKDTKDPITHKVLHYDFKPSKWEIFEFARDSAEQVAELAGATKVVGFLSVVGGINSAVDFIGGIMNWNDNWKETLELKPRDEAKMDAQDERRWQWYNRATNFANLLPK